MKHCSSITPKGFESKRFLTVSPISFPSSEPLHLLTGGLVVFNLLARNVVKLRANLTPKKVCVILMVALFPLWFSCEKTWGQLHGFFLGVFFFKIMMSKIKSSTVLSKLVQSSRVFLVERIEWNLSSIDQQHQSLGDRSTCFFHVLDMPGILKIVV